MTQVKFSASMTYGASICAPLLEAADRVDPLRHPPAETREALARAVFIADNSTVPPEKAGADWDNEELIFSRDYAFNIADGLLARGWGRVQ